MLVLLFKARFKEFQARGQAGFRLGNDSPTAWQLTGLILYTALLDTDNPVTYGPLDLQDYYFEHKRQQSEAMKSALKTIPEVLKDFEKTFGRRYDFVEEYNLDDADIVIVAMSSTAGTVKLVVDQLRAKGIKAGLLRLRISFPS